ncbi:MAG: hypothetical protein OHK93_005469 [Ramalina farinacea]|uniref:Uncharacterized protein n=1 Tax=Ramalina farinacea TaxID=258253 RepID=A0AA43TS39_9LECA|nr:hypothetical protein [Ramalina farinacea]
MSGILNLVFSSSSSSRPHYHNKAQPRSLDAPPPLPPASTWTRHRSPNHRRTVSFDATSEESTKEDPLAGLRKENRRFKRKIEHLARQKEIYHDLLEKSGIEVPEVPEVPETPSSHLDEDDEPADTAKTRRLNTATPRTNTPDPIPYWINASNSQAKLLQVLIAILLGRARIILRVSPSDPSKIEALAMEALAHSLHSSLKKDRALIAHCQFYLGLARFGQGRYPEAAEYLDMARAAVAGRYLEGELVDEWVNRCSNAMGETQSPTWTDPRVPSKRVPQTNDKRKGKESAAALSPTPPTRPQHLSTTSTAAAARTHHHHTSSSATTIIRPPSPPPLTPFPPSYLHNYASRSPRSPSRSPPPLPADFPLLALVNSHGNSSATVMPTSPNAFSPGGAYSSPPSSLEGTPEMAQGAFEALPAGPTHRRGRSGGAGGISSKLAFWEGQRSTSGSDSSPVEGGQRPPQQERSASPEPVGAREEDLPSPVLAQPSGEESDDDDSEDEQRRQFLDTSSDDNDNDADDESPAVAANHGEVLADYFPSRTNSHRSDYSSIKSAVSSIFGDGIRRSKMSGDESPLAGQAETLANFWSSRANSMRSSRADSIRSDAPPPSRPSSVRSEVPKLGHPQPLSRANSAYLPSARPSRTQSLLSQASSSLHSVAESEEEEADDEGGADGVVRPVGEMIAGKWKRQVEQPMRSRVGSRVSSRRGIEGSGSGSEKEGPAAGAEGLRGRKKQKRSRRERKAARAAAGAAGRS